MNDAMVTIWLLWQLFAGTPRDVDSFVEKSHCEEAKARATEMLKSAIAQTHNDELAKLEYVGCLPLEIKVPGNA